MTAIDERLVEALCRAAERDDGDADAVVRAHVRRLAPLATAPDSERLVRAAVARLDGLGCLDALLGDDGVDEILVNAGGDIWVERNGATSPGRVDRRDRPRRRHRAHPRPTRPPPRSHQPRRRCPAR